MPYSLLKQDMKCIKTLTILRFINVQLIRIKQMQMFPLKKNEKKKLFQFFRRGCPKKKKGFVGGGVDW